MKSIVRSMCVVGAAAVSVTMLGAGVASADIDLTNITYADASEKISGMGAKAVIASVVGSDLPTDDCRVTRYQKGSFRDPRGNKRSVEVLLYLDCNASLASAGKPGASAASPEGRKAKQDQDFALMINQNPGWCGLKDENMQFCTAICDKTRMCEV
jgi:hypothetical protein